MANLLNKLNVLVKSSIHGALGNESGPSARRDRSSRHRLGKNIDTEVTALRDRVNKALDDEDRMVAEIAALKEQIASWDQQADQALTNGDEATARHVIQRMQRQQQHAALLESDLAQHRISTSELIRRVNELEAIVAEARRQAESAPAATGDAADTDTSTEESLSDRLRQIRQQVTERVQETAPAVTEPEQADAQQAVEDDLAQRRARLSL